MTALGKTLTAEQLILTKGRDLKLALENVTDPISKTPQNFEPGDLYIELITGGAQNGLQEILVEYATGGSYTLALDSHVTADITYYDITSNPLTIAQDIQTKLEALPNIGAGNVLVHPGQLTPVWRIALTLHDSTNEIQEILFTGTVPTSGTFKLAYNGAPTGPIAYNATAATVQASLNAIPAIGDNNTVVTAIAGGYQVQFVGERANTNMAQITAYTSGTATGGGTFGILDAIGAFLGGILAFFGPPAAPAAPAAPTANIVTKTIVSGQARLNAPLVQVFENVISNLFNSYQTLGGIAQSFEVKDQHNVVFRVVGTKTYAENDILIFDVDVPASAIQGAVNNTTALSGVINTYLINFYWAYVVPIEFINNTGNNTVNILQANTANLVDSNSNGEQNVVVTQLQEGRNPITKWPFTISGAGATMKVESQQVDQIQPRTKWQLVFLPTGEAAGGEPVSAGITYVQQR